MFQWILGFILLFGCVYFCYTRKVHTPRLTLVGYASTGLLFATLCGVSLNAMVLFWASSPARAWVGVFSCVAFLALELLWCLQLSDVAFGRYQHMLRLVSLYHKGLLVETPFRQGEKLYWIDFAAQIPRVRKMYFVIMVSGCYIGIYEDGRRLVSVRQVFANRQSAKEVLSDFECRLYAHR